MQSKPKRTFLDESSLSQGGSSRVCLINTQPDFQFTEKAGGMRDEKNVSTTFPLFYRLPPLSPHHHHRTIILMKKFWKTKKKWSENYKRISFLSSQLKFFSKAHRTTEKAKRDWSFFMRWPRRHEESATKLLSDMYDNSICNVER